MTRIPDVKHFGVCLSELTHHNTIYSCTLVAGHSGFHECDGGVKWTNYVPGRHDTPSTPEGQAHALASVMDKIHDLRAERVDHPSHYGGGDHPHEHVKCMEGIGLTNNAFLYNCTKYIWRNGKKSNALEDLKKARWYLDREIQRLEKEGK